MSGLNGYLADKRVAVRAYRAAIENGSRSPILNHAAVTTVEGRTGVRRIRVGEFSVVMDSGPEYGGFTLGPSSQELMIGTLSSCLSHSYITNAALLEIPLDAVQIEVTATQDERAGSEGFEDVPVYPTNVRYLARISSSAPFSEIQRLRESVEAKCPLYNLVRAGQPIAGDIEYTPTDLDSDGTANDAA